MSVQDFIAYGSLLLLVGGPTTIGTAIAIRVAIHGGIALTRIFAVSATAGLVATTAAFVLPTQGGGEPGVPGFPEIAAETLAVETLEFVFKESSEGFAFEFQDGQFSPAEAERLILEAARIGEVKEVRVWDTVRHSGGELLQIRGVCETFGLGFEIVEHDLRSDIPL